ncbi:MAG: S8 family serine peptidase, partial [Acidobacteria bacterium]|nr:S8 family serine peptidase [Acidobacteriota bacterium]
MTRALRYLVPLLLAVGLLPAQPLKYAPYRTGQILIKPKLAASSLLLQALHNTHGASIARVFARVGNIQVLRLPKTMNVEQAVALYRANPFIEFAEPDYLVSINQTQTFPNDLSFNQLWGLHNTGQAGGTVNADINAPEAWSLRTSASSIVVGVVDTGIDYNHPDLAANMWTNPGEIPNNGIDDDKNGFVDDVFGINAITDTGNPMDDDGHGTHVAGTIGAVGNNGTGVTGVAWNVKLMALKFIGGGSGSTADAIQCINYALSKGVQILSNSWGGGGFSQPLYDAISSAKDQGVLFVAAAGNESLNNDTAISFPASYDLPNVVSVAATDRNDTLAGYSNFGYRRVHLGAPGSDIYSTLPNNGYGVLSGTSMATPHVAGALALLKAQFPALAYDELIRRLLLATDARSNLDQTTLSGGRLNLYRALANLQRPIPHFTVSPRSGSPPLTVTFTDSSLGTLTSRTLNAGAGGSAIALSGSTSFTYSTSGTYPATLTVAGPDGTATRSQSIRVQPPYTVASNPYAWFDTTGMTALSLDDDSISAAVTLPFSFPFFGGQFNTAYISANGLVTLGTPNGGSEFANTAIPNTTAPNNALYPFWDDLDPSTGGTIRYGTSGGNFVVSWENIAHRSDTSRTYPLSFQIVLNRWGGIQYNYREVRPTRLVYGGGRGATVGIEDEFGSMATQSSFNTNSLTNLSARSFSRGTVTLSAATASVPAAGGSANLTVTPAEPAYAAWSVSGQPAWLSVDVSANPHVFTAAANTDPNPRTATLTIGDKSFTLTQAGSPGTVTLSPAAAAAAAAGATGVITVTPSPSTYTSWTVTGNPAWLTVSTTGNTVNWTAQANNSVTARSATLIIGDKSFALSQSGATGSLTLNPTSASAPAPGGTGAITVTPTPADFNTWTVSTPPAWLTVSTTGNTINWTASANNSVTSRSATLTIGDKSFTLSQSGATGSLSLSPTSATVAAAGATGSITVTPTPADFTTWTVSTPPAWLTTTRTATAVSWTAQANNSVSSRSHTLTIGDKSFTFTQSGAVGSVTLSAASGSAPPAGGSGSVTVTPSPADFTTWTVSAPPAWLSATRTATAVSWTAQANNSVNARAATLTIGDKTYTVNQSGAAGSVTLTPATATVPSSGGAATITVTPTPADYNTWTVSGNPSWLTVSTSGNTVSWNAAANNSVNARSANVTIGDKTFTLNQSGATGSLTLSASSASIPSAGGSGTVSATPNPADYTNWTVTGQPAWLTVTQSANVVSWSAPAINSVTARTAALAIGNQTYTLTQAGAVGSVALSAASAAAAPTGGTGSFAVTPTPSDFTSWSVTGAPAWLTLTTSGNTVNWTVAAINSVNARTATLTISNQTFTLTQSGAPGSITLGASTATVGALGGSGSVAINATPADYTGWTVSSSPSWLILSTSGSTLSWTAAANNSVSPRTATLAIGNQTFTLSQLGATGSLSISPASASAPGGGITGTITVTPTPADYKTWTVSGQPAWLSVTTTENTITWTAAANNSIAARSATLTIGDKSFTLAQAGATGSVTISPTAASAPATGASGSITVTPTPTDFTTWTVTGAPAWLTVSTTGNTITWTAAPNNSV